MRDKLLTYYEKELGFIRRDASRFAAQYPAVAGRLLLEPGKCEDPHVERIIEAFAMLSARVHMRIDDGFPEIAGGLLNQVQPHYLAPIPSMTVVKMHRDADQGTAAEGVFVERHSMLYSKPVEGVRCRFRTCYPVTLWPIEVAGVEVIPVEETEAACPEAMRDSAGAIRLRLKTKGGLRFSELPIDSLRFFLDGDSRVAHRLYEAIFNEARGVRVQNRSGSGHVYLDRDRIRPVGFDASEGMLDYPFESFIGYRLLQEYFTLPEKFLFFDLAELSPAFAGLNDEQADIEILVEQWITDLVDKVEPDNFQLGCTPATNLFSLQADPVTLNHKRSEYPVVPDVHAPYAYEVHSLNEVYSSTSGSDRKTVFKPFCSLHHNEGGGEGDAFFYARRRPSIRKDDKGSDLYLTLVDRGFDMADVPADVLKIRALCTNRDLPSRLPFQDPGGDFEIERHPAISHICCLRKPTNPIRTHLEEDARWRMLSHLSLNYLSLSDFDEGESEGGNAVHAFREILRLYDFTDSAATRQRIEGVTGLRTRRVTRRLNGTDSGGFVRGIEAMLELDEDKFAGSGVFLFASVLEAFLGQYVSVNSFVETVATLRQREGIMKRWPLRAGRIQLL